MKITSSLVNFGAFCKRNHQQLVAGLITCSLSLGIIGLRENYAFKQIELSNYDSMMRWQLNEPSDRRVVIVEISESDIQKFRWPFSDRLFAKLISQISLVS